MLFFRLAVQWTELLDLSRLAKTEFAGLKEAVNCCLALGLISVARAVSEAMEACNASMSQAMEACSGPRRAPCRALGLSTSIRKRLLPLFCQLTMPSTPVCLKAQLEVAASTSVESRITGVTSTFVCQLQPEMVNWVFVAIVWFHMFQSSDVSDCF